MNERTGAKPTDHKKNVIFLADERKRREMQELVKLFGQFYQGRSNHEQTYQKEKREAATGNDR